MIITFAWQVSGEIRLNERNGLFFPAVGPEAGIYRLSAREGREVSVYIGETHDLRQRLHKNYRYPPKGATTSIWVNAWLTDQLSAGRRVEVSVVAEPSVVIGDEDFTIDLRRKADRLLIENAAIALARLRGEQLLNKPGIGELREDRVQHSTED